VILNLDNYISQHRVNAMKYNSTYQKKLFDFHSTLNQVYKSESVTFKFLNEHYTLCFTSANGLHILAFFPENYCPEISHS